LLTQPLLRVAYRTGGDKHAAPLLLLRGWPDDASTRLPIFAEPAATAPGLPESVATRDTAHAAAGEAANAVGSEPLRLWRLGVAAPALRAR
jgi:hypothetical protein